MCRNKIRNQRERADSMWKNSIWGTSLFRWGGKSSQEGWMNEWLIEESDDVANWHLIGLNNNLKKKLVDRTTHWMSDSNWNAFKCHSIKLGQMPLLQLPLLPPVPPVQCTKMKKKPSIKFTPYFSVYTLKLVSFL